MRALHILFYDTSHRCYCVLLLIAHVASHVAHTNRRTTTSTTRAVARALPNLRRGSSGYVRLHVRLSGRAAEALGLCAVSLFTPSLCLTAVPR